MGYSGLTEEAAVKRRVRELFGGTTNQCASRLLQNRTFLYKEGVLCGDDTCCPAAKRALGYYIAADSCGSGSDFPNCGKTQLEAVLLSKSLELLQDKSIPELDRLLVAAVINARLYQIGAEVATGKEPSFFPVFDEADYLEIIRVLTALDCPLHMECRQWLAKRYRWEGRVDEAENILPPTLA